MERFENPITNPTIYLIPNYHEVFEVITTNRTFGKLKQIY